MRIPDRFRSLAKRETVSLRRERKSGENQNSSSFRRSQNRRSVAERLCSGSRHSIEILPARNPEKRKSARMVRQGKRLQTGLQSASRRSGGAGTQHSELRSRLSGAPDGGKLPWLRIRNARSRIPLAGTISGRKRENLGQRFYTEKETNRAFRMHLSQRIVGGSGCSEHRTGARTRKMVLCAAADGYVMGDSGLPSGKREACRQPLFQSNRFRLRKKSVSLV